MFKIAFRFRCARAPALELLRLLWRPPLGACCGRLRLSPPVARSEKRSQANEDIEITKSPIDSERLASLISRIKDNTISGKIAKNLFEIMATDSSSVDEIIKGRGLEQVTDVEEIEKLIVKVIADNPNQVQQFRDGKEQVLGFLIGQAMKVSQGKANPEQVNKLLKEKI